MLRYVKGLIEKERAEQLKAVDPTDEEAIDTINYHIVSIAVPIPMEKSSKLIIDVCLG